MKNEKKQEKDEKDRERGRERDDEELIRTRYEEERRRKIHEMTRFIIGACVDASVMKLPPQVRPSSSISISPTIGSIE